MRNFYVVATVAATLLSAANVSAQTRFYGEDNNGTELVRATNVNALAARNSFFSNLVGVGTETFEGFSSGAGAPLGLNFGVAGTASLVGTGNISEQGAGTNGVGRYPISGTKFWETQITTASSFKVTFSQRVAAFGFYAIDLGDFDSDLTLKFLRGGSVIDTWKPYASPNSSCPNPYCGSIKYIGTINTAEFDEVQFFGSNTTDYFAFDDMSVGSLEQVSVSEPSALVLLAAGFGVLGVVRRRRGNSIA